jgi:ribosomal-protein-alanine N-acetyltransferase
VTENSWELEQATEMDIQGICEIEISCFSTPWSERSIRDFIADTNRSFCVVARSGSRVCGYIGLQYVLDEGDICNIGVLPEYRCRGIARSLMERLFEICKTRGITTIHLEVRTGNTKAIDLYEKTGFRMNGRRRGYYADTGEDALLYMRVIS